MNPSSASRGAVVAFALGCLASCSTGTSSSLSVPPAAVEPAPSCIEVASSEEKIVVKNDLGALEGTMLVPAGCGPVPVVLVIPGSGPTDRDGNAPRMYRLLAEALAERGIASVRYDKAGIGASKKAAPPMDQFVFERGADDAALFVRALHEDARFARVIVAGHSEGSLLGILASRRAKVDGLVSIAGAGRPIGKVLREQLAKNITDPALLAKVDAILAALGRGEHVTDVPPELATVFHPSIQGYFISWMKYDPPAELRDAPIAHVAVVQGTTDVQVSMEDATLLAAARPDARLVAIDGMNHVLKAAQGTTAAAQEKAYTDPSLPIVPRLVDEVAAAARAE